MLLITDVFGELLSSLFSEKACHRECITLKENDKPITNNEELGKTFSKIFGNIVPTLDIDTNLGDNRYVKYRNFT